MVADLARRLKPSNDVAATVYIAVHSLQDRTMEVAAPGAAVQTIGDVPKTETLLARKMKSRGHGRWADSECEVVF
jgi:hypothetical protein